MYASTLTGSGSGKELLFPLRKLFHALQGFFLGHHCAPWALDFNFFHCFRFLDGTFAIISSYLGNTLQSDNDAGR
jgi:hypothetical protein